MPYAYCVLAGTVLLLYDTVLTFGTEVNVIWRRKLGVKTLIHILNRYSTIAAYISAVVLLFPVNDQTCHSLNIFEAICIVLPNISWSLFSSLRIYALSNRNIPLSIFVFVLNMMYIVPYIYIDTIYGFFNAPPPYGCIQNFVEHDALVSLLWTSRGMSLLGETIVLVWTFKKTVRWQSAPLIREHGSSPMLSEVFFNNGVTCFAVPLVLNVIMLTLTVMSTDMNARNCLTVFLDVFTTILLARFLLDLGEFGAHPNGTDTFSEGAGTGMMRFVSELSGSHAESISSVMRETTSGDEYESGVRS